MGLGLYYYTSNAGDKCFTYTGSSSATTSGSAFFFIHVINFVNILSYEIAPLEVFDNVGLFAVHYEAELFNCVHALRSPIVEVTVDQREAYHLVTVFMQLGIS